MYPFLPKNLRQVHIKIGKTETVLACVFVFNLLSGVYKYEISYLYPIPLLTCVLVWIVNVSVLMLLLIFRDKVGFKEVGLWKLIILVLCARFFYFLQRWFSGLMTVDPDIGLYYKYGKKFASGTYPYMEYPQVALLFFTLVFFASHGDLTTYRIVFPLAEVPFEAMIIVSLYGIGKKFNNLYLASLFSGFYAIFPFTMIFWFSKYDVIPTSLLLFSIYQFIREKYALSSLALAFGFLAKWFPILMLPFLLAHLWREGRTRAVLKYALAFSVTSALILIPFLSADPEAFFYTYEYHSRRRLTGESFFYIPLWFLKPTCRLPASVAPWFGVSNIPFPGMIITIFQVLVFLFLFILFTLYPMQFHNTISFAGAAVVTFPLLNKIFSPQYLLWMIGAYMASFLALLETRKRNAVFVLLLGLLPLLSFLIWPRFVSYWIIVSVLFFSINLLLVFYLVCANLRPYWSGWFTFRSAVKDLWLSVYRRIKGFPQQSIADFKVNEDGDHQKHRS